MAGSFITPSDTRRIRFWQYAENRERKQAGLPPEGVTAAAARQTLCDRKIRRGRNWKFNPPISNEQFREIMGW